MRERPPAWLVMLGAGASSVEPSPDGRKVAFATKTDAGEVHIFIVENRLDAQGKPICEDPIGQCCVTCDALPGGIRAAARTNPGWIADPANPQGHPLGIFFLHNEHPSSWGGGGQGQGGQFYAIRADGTALTPLLPPYPPHAFHYQAHPSRDASHKLFWTSTWDPSTGRVGSHNLLMGDLTYNASEGRFELKQISSILPGLDHGWYEAHALPGDFAANPTVFFTSTAHSMQSTRGFMGRLGTDGRLQTIFKLTYPDEINPHPFMIDYHPAWNEHFVWVDRGRQVVYFTSNPTASAAERYDWFLAYPPFLEGALVGLTIYDIRFAALYPEGYLIPNPGQNPPIKNLEKQWIANIDGTKPERLFQQALDAGWKLIAAARFLDGKVYAAQEHPRQGKRYVVIPFAE